MDPDKREQHLPSSASTLQPFVAQVHPKPDSFSVCLIDLSGFPLPWIHPAFSQGCTRDQCSLSSQSHWGRGESIFASVLASPVLDCSLMCPCVNNRMQGIGMRSAAAGRALCHRNFQIIFVLCLLRTHGADETPILLLRIFLCVQCIWQVDVKVNVRGKKSK